MFAKPDEKLIEQLIELRKTLHRNPELSGRESQTASRIKKFLLTTDPDEIHEKIGGHGLMAIYDSGVKGPELMLCCNIDALPIQEDNKFDHRSENNGIAHKCGHDGHTAILAGVAAMLGREKLKTGRVILLFQPEEETGRGAEKVLHDKVMASIKPDMVFALHNLPGFKKNTVIIKEGVFSSASRGMIINLKGKPSHAAHPEQGRSPLNMLRDLLTALPSLPGIKDSFKSFCLVTIIHAQLGEKAFGTNPGEAVVMGTLRSFLNEDMVKLCFLAESLVSHLAVKHKITASFEYTELFPATNNHPMAVKAVAQAAEMNNIPLITIREPFKWSEDFGHYSSRFPAALFGLGAGKDYPGLHNSNYDFNDNLIETGINIFLGLIWQQYEPKSSLPL